jgi:D-arabinose 5-phosphate isomerase GutQ
MTRDLTGRAARVLTIEAEGLLALREKLDRQFTRAVDMLLSAPGKVIVTGMGKSGHIGRKIAATLASTGTPAFFLHPAEGLHGDIGMVLKGDVVIALSNSGETREVVQLLPVFKRLGLQLIALTGNPRSTLARHADATKQHCRLAPNRTLPSKGFSHGNAESLRERLEFGPRFRIVDTPPGNDQRAFGRFE